MKLIAAVFGALVAVSVSADQAAITANINADLEKSVPALTKHFTDIVATKGLDPWKDAVPDIPLNLLIPFGDSNVPVTGTVSVGDITGLASGSVKSLVLSDLTGDAGEVSGKITVNMDWSKNLTVALTAAVEAMNMDGEIAAGLFLQKLGVEAVVDAVVKVVNSTSYCLESASVNDVTTQFEKVGTTKVELKGTLKALESLIADELPKLDAEIVKNKDMVDKYLKSEVKTRVEEFMDDFIQTQKCKGGAGTAAEGNTAEIKKSTKKAVDEAAAAGLDETSASASLVPSTVVALFVAACAIMN